MEHLASDIKNIKDSLIRICKYILGKSIEGDKANSVKDLEDVGKVAWGFISSLYKVYWDSLVMDDTNMLFRNKVKSKFSSQIVKKLSNNKGKTLVKPSYISSLPPPILAKSLKEVNKISKFFKKNFISAQKNFYAQVLSNSNMSNIAKETLKIKEAFPRLQNKKIEQIQNIISGDSKPKLCINITTKELSYKQVIVPISIENAKKIIKDSSTHVININKSLKSIKSNIMANFICIDNKDIVISTNNVTSPSNLWEIKKCIKSSLCTDMDQIDPPRLPQSKSYLKIVGILYLSEQFNTRLSSEEVERILKSIHIFNNIVFVMILS